MHAIRHIARFSLRTGRRRLTAAAALATTAALATLAAPVHARNGWSVDLNVGLPIGQGWQPHGDGDLASPLDVNRLPAGAVGVQVGGGRSWRHGGSWYRPWGPRWALVAPLIVVPLAQAVPLAAQPAAGPPPEPSHADPVIVPRNGQDAQQTEHDRQQCNRWATTQPAALADAAVFHRAVAACMEERGYTTR